MLHTDKQSIVNQREVGTDTADFHAALRRVLRQDPDVILIGEMRDPETVATALSAAETGHLVFSTLHTINATETINRIIDFFPPHQQRQIRMAVAGVAPRHREPAAGRDARRRRTGAGRSRCWCRRAACSTRSSNSDETHEIEEIIADGEYYGMQTFDQSLLSLYQTGRDRPARGAGRIDPPARPPPADRPAHALGSRSRRAEEPPVGARTPPLADGAATSDAPTTRLQYGRASATPTLRESRA